MLDTDGEQLLQIGVVSEGLTEKAHLSKNMKIEKTKCKGLETGVFLVCSRKSQETRPRARRGWQVMASGREPEARTCSVP